MRVFEGTYKVKQYKNDNGDDFPFTIDAKDKEHAREMMKDTMDAYIDLNKYYSWKFTEFSERR